MVHTFHVWYAANLMELYRLTSSFFAISLRAIVWVFVSGWYIDGPGQRRRYVRIQEQEDEEKLKHWHENTCWEYNKILIVPGENL